MRGKCDRCGNIVKFPFQAKHRFRTCFKCGGKIFQRYTSKGEYYLKKKYNPQ